MGNLVLLDAPSNLGLRPPAEGVVPGCYKAPGALRDHGLLTRLGAADGGVVTPPRYLPDWSPGSGVRNAAGIAAYTAALAGRLAKIRADGGFPVVLGGDCSIALAAMLTLRREGRYGIVYFDGHDDFRHLGNSEYVANVGGEALAVVTGRGQPELADVDGLKPYVRDEDVLVLGVRAEESAEARDAGLRVVTSQEIMASGTDGALAAAREIFAPLDGFWIHIDIDTLDPEYVSAVDSPDPGGLSPDRLVELLRGLLVIPGAAGLELTIFDPDLDPDGTQAALVTDCLVRALEGPR
ncbi:arginase family protein [Amycolatopsis keratiniphila]|uniref:Arginase n=1 Tax=Amycolatopsis keratiniphila subsp. keratiniphila TaxID=227715 RepID=A0A1W2LVV0_9PSEU|nr:arginase family protein [Amycolatopsis keratiniphila]ONF70454.1 arginase [Amycolatopsis keratiniphila subsp. keratiniphila]